MIPRKPYHQALASLLLGAALALAAALVRADVANPEPLTAFPQSLLAIRTQSGTVLNFQIWIADSPGREEQGLMYVREMDLHAGMLFIFPGIQRVSMWMKNTYLPLDMLFIEAGGRINHIAPNAVPLSLDIISAPEPARAVLELKGGAAEQLGIHVGDIVVERHLHDAK